MRFFGLLVFGLALVYGAIVVTDPWALHIGGRWTPLLYWSGSGKLVTKHGDLSSLHFLLSLGPFFSASVGRLTPNRRRAGRWLDVYFAGCYAILETERHDLWRLAQH